MLVWLADRSRYNVKVEATSEVGPLTLTLALILDRYHEYDYLMHSPLYSSRTVTLHTLNMGV